MQVTVLSFANFPEVGLMGWLKAPITFMAFDTFCSNTLQKQVQPVNTPTHEEEPMGFSEAQPALETDALNVSTEGREVPLRNAILFVSAAHRIFGHVGG